VKLFLMFIGLALFAAEDKPKEPTVADLQKKISELENKLTVQTKISQKFHDIADQCQINLVYSGANSEVKQDGK